MSASSGATEACVVLHRSRPLLEPLLAGLRAQTVPFARWIFCICGEDDGSRALLERQPERPLVIARPDNPGFAGGANAAIAAARERFVFLLNPDVELAPDHHELLRAALIEEGAAAAGGLLLRRDERERVVIDSAGFSVQPWLRIVDRYAGRSPEAVTLRREAVPGVCGAAMLADRPILLEAAEDGEVFDQAFWMYKEDQDLCLRLRELGEKVIFEPRAIAWHGRGFPPGARAGIPLLQRRHSLKNRYLLLQKHLRARHLWRAPLLVIFELALGTRLLVSEPATCGAWAMAWRLRRATARKRRALKRRARAEGW